MGRNKGVLKVIAKDSVSEDEMGAFAQDVVDNIPPFAEVVETQVNSSSFPESEQSFELILTVDEDVVGLGSLEGRLFKSVRNVDEVEVESLFKN